MTVHYLIKFGTLFDYRCLIAQLVEQATVNRLVVGSSPTQAAIFRKTSAQPRFHNEISAPPRILIRASASETRTLSQVSPG